MKKVFVLVSLTLLAAFVLTACGGGGGGGGGDAATTIQADMTDFAFSPDTWTVPAGQEITLSLTNSGSVAHDWVLMIVPATAPFGADDEPNVQVDFQLEPGETQDVTFTAPSEAGTYDVVCSVQGHLEAGMKGTLTVTAP